MAALLLQHTAAASGWTSGRRASARAKKCSRSRRRLLCQRREFEGDITSLRSGCMGINKFSNGKEVLHEGQNGSQTRVRASFEELAHNQVLVSALTATTLGQLAKPFAAALSGKGFNWKLVTKSGGMPSSHSAAVTAAATALAFERGLSDGVFGLSCILAGIVVYDAQGVRNAVGKQAKVINTMVVSYAPLEQTYSTTSTPAATPPTAIGAELARGPVQAELAFLENADTPSTTPRPPSTTATSEKTIPGNTNLKNMSNRAANAATNGSYIRSSKFFELAGQLPSMKGGEVDIQELGNQDGWRLLPLKESIGHTKLEVLVGAIWGIAITISFHTIYHF